MDFSWVRQLAEQSNQHELDRQEKERQRLEDEQLLALATVPFVEKFYMLFQAYCDEFNKHAIFPGLRVSIGRLSKRSKGPYEVGALSFEEISYFTFTRKGWMYGIRGINGSIEFVKFPVSEGAASLNMKLDEMGADVVYKLNGKIEGEATDIKSKQVVWMLNDTPMPGPHLTDLCQRFFVDFVSRTNE
ncbi:MAG: hypothetical protein K2X27_26550 [Candidatus Obscuribacterales bacterium]|nr:hypothetical protein [Candidatus Obscuribacterales bacterium]